MFFSTKNVKQIVEANEGFAYKDGVKKCAEIWNAMDEAARNEYNDLAAKDVERHEAEVKQLEKTGKFTN